MYKIRTIQKREILMSLLFTFLLHGKIIFISKYQKYRHLLKQ